MRQAHSRPHLQALIEGHDQARIVGCYANALWVCHGFAVDRAAHVGKVVRFNPSSTVSKARKLLAKDSLDRKARVRRWYDSNPQTRVAANAPFMSVEEMRVQIAATFPKDN